MLMNRLAIAALLLLPLSQAIAKDDGATTQPSFAHDTWLDHAGGKLMLRSFDTAPYPHASRENGYKSAAGEFPREPHYVDSTVGIFLPPGFDPDADVNFVVHFHGHRNQVANVIVKYQLPEQFVASKVNAVLLFPQGPFMAPDSGGGKLELDPDGFKRFITQITGYLHEQKVISHDRVGHITLSAHSGGYKTAGGVLHLGGMNDHITDVLLLDASYGSLGYFVEFAKAHPQARLVSFHTKHLDDENVELKRLLDEQNVASKTLEESTLDEKALASRGVLFISTQLAHDAVAYERGYFRQCLTTADLPRVR